MVNRSFSLFFIILMMFSVVVSAENYPKPYDYYVNDYANIFTEGEIYHLQSLFYEILSNTTAEVVLVTLPSLNGSDISEYTFGLANYWGVGKADKDNGIVILYSKAENKIFVATGYGIEGILPDSKLGRMLDDYYVPYRDEGNISLGIISFSEELNDILLKNADEIRSNTKNNSSDKLPISIFFIILFFFLVGIISYLSSGRKNRGLGDFATFFIVDFIIRSMLLSGRSSSSGGFGGGGGGFGGGGFGGGGAGR